MDWVELKLKENIMYNLYVLISMLTSLIKVIQIVGLTSITTVHWFTVTPYYGLRHRNITTGMSVLVITFLCS